ncbi:MAG: MoxR family ATPase, partial [Acidobacteriota bacterium]|nr:MoxR family ATPase [Acidobacteriota bacterium]
HELPDPFTVMATQNPLEHVGTFPLPESQLDRFLMSLKLGYPPRDEERSLLLSGGVQNLLREIEPVVSAEEIRELQRRAEQIKVTEKLADYALSLAEATRSSQQLLLGISTRGVQGLLSATRALALCEGRDFAVPDDVQRLAPAVLSHRIALKVGSSSLAVRREAIRKIVHETPVPA